MSKRAYCIFCDTLTGPIPAWHDENGNPVVYETRNEAEREIADTLITRLSEFLAGMREFEEALAVDDYIVEVIVSPDGSITHPVIP